MSDFIREVDEEYRQDQFRNFLTRYWRLIGILIVLVLVGVGAWRGIQYWQQGRAEAAGARYFDALSRSRDDAPAAVAALDAVVRDGGGYGLLARMLAASERGRTDPAGGIRAFDAIANDPSVDPDLREVARLRAAILAADTAEPAEVQRRLEPLADANGTFRNVARELLALSALKAGDDAGAKRWLDAIENDGAATLDMRQRAAIYLSLVRSGNPPQKP